MKKRVITKNELEKILENMDKYKRNEGYMYYLGGKLYFFDEDTKLWYINAVKFTRDELIGWIENYDNEDFVHLVPLL
jgi:hypothetical protein